MYDNMTNKILESYLNDNESYLKSREVLLALVSYKKETVQNNKYRKKKLTESVLSFIHTSFHTDSTLVLPTGLIRHREAQ